MKKIKICLLACLCLLSCFSIKAQSVNSSYEDGAVYVRFKDASQVKNAQGTNKIIAFNKINVLRKASVQFPLQEVRSKALFNSEVLSRTVEINMENPSKIDELIAFLQKDPDIELVEKKPLFYTCDAGGDPLYKDSSGFRLKWHLDLIDAEKAWAIQKGTKNIKVAIIDNAVYGNHEDLQIKSENLYNVAFARAGSANPPASVDSMETCNATYTCPSYDWSHGTHCAGAAGAINNNGVGIASMGGGVTLMGVSCPGSSGIMVRNTMKGVEWAAENGANVISMSFGSPTGFSLTDEASFQSMADQGIILVAAAGNNSSSANFYPASYSSIISVGSVDSDLKISIFSNFGKMVDIAAPGGFYVNQSSGQSTEQSIFSTTYALSQSYRLMGANFLVGKRYDGMYGTSMACPVFAGMVGVLLSYDSTLNYTEVLEAFRSSSMPLAENSKKIAPDRGCANMHNALKALQNRINGPSNAELIKEKANVTLEWEAPKAGSGAFKYYRIYKNDELLLDNFTGLTYTDSNLLKGYYTYGISAVYEDDKESFRSVLKTYIDEFFYIKAIIEPEGSGTVFGTGSFPAKQDVTIRAIRNPGYVFDRWEAGGVIESKDTVLQINLRKNTTFTAYFKRDASIEENTKEDNFKIYPNPVKDILYLEDINGIAAFSIYDTRGKALISNKILTEKSIDVSSLSSGMYILRLMKNGNMIHKKFSVKK